MSKYEEVEKLNQIVFKGALNEKAFDKIDEIISEIDEINYRIERNCMNVKSEEEKILNLKINMLNSNSELIKLSESDEIHKFRIVRALDESFMFLKKYTLTLNRLKSEYILLNEQLKKLTTRFSQMYSELGVEDMIEEYRSYFSCWKIRSEENGKN